MNFLNLTSFLKIRPSKFSKEREASVVTPPAPGQALELDYWKQQLKGELPVMEWPASRIHTPLQYTDRKTHTFTVQPELTGKINAYANKQHAGIGELLLAALRILLFRYSRQEDLVIGNLITESKSSGSQLQDKVVINALPLRIKVTGQQSFKDLLAHTQEVAADAYAHRNISYKTLVKEIKPATDNGNASIFQVLFHWKESSSNFPDQQNTIIQVLKANDITVPDLVVELFSQAGLLFCQINYESQLLSTDTIERLATHLELLLHGIAENDNLPVALLPMLTLAELDQQLIRFNQPDVENIPACAHILFEQQVSRTPDAIAVVFDGQSLTYQELNNKANQLAHRLQRYGVGPEVIVGLCLNRSPQLLIGLMAVLKAGGAFMPLDPNLPADRLSFMLEDAAPALIITQEGLADLPVIAAHISLIFIDRDWPWISQESTANTNSTVEAHNLMYVIYTSGSSGKPKGVLIEHTSLTGFLKAYEKVIALNEQDRVLQFVPVVFDPMVEDIFCTFHKGATLVLRTEEMSDSAEIFLEKCREWGITLLNLPAAFWHLLAGELTTTHELQLPATIRIVKVGGERLLPQKVHAWKKQFGNFPRLLNAYGPTETTIAATMYDCQDFTSEESEVPIGFRLMNLKAYVLDSHLQPVPIGVSGELCIGGDALARGYLNRIELNAQKFNVDPFSRKSGARLYRTGDLVRYLPDGKLEYQNRIDSQVKIRGFRIELGEIESVLGQHPQVKQVAVVVREEVAGDKRIVAYVVTESGNIEMSALRAYLLEQLPAYMIPSVFIPLEKLPLTFNGKIDRNALPVPDYSTQLTEHNRAPKTKEEKLLADIWKDILNVKEVGVQDHFFEAGGYSLLATRLIAEIKRTFHTKLPLSWVFAHPTISDQAKYLAATPDPNLWDTLINIRIGGTKPSLYLIHDGYGGVEYGFQLAQFLDKVRSLYGFQAIGLNGIDEPMQGVQTIARFYIDRLLTHQPEGVYHLAAYSGGATIAFEMACQLKAIGKEVGILAIFDSYPVNLNRFTYQRIGLSYVMRSIWNLIISSQVPIHEKMKMIVYEIPKIVRVNWMRIHVRTKEKTNNTVVSSSEKIFRIMRKSNDSYLFKQYPGSILFIRAIENQARYIRNSDFGWGRFVKQVKVYDLPGNHKTLFKIKENTKNIAGILDMHLAAYENKDRPAD